MLRNRYIRSDLFALELRPGLRFEPRVERVDHRLDDVGLFERVRKDSAAVTPRSPPAAGP